MGEPQWIEQAYRFALRPTPEQERFLTACAGASRFFYDLLARAEEAAAAWGDAVPAATRERAAHKCARRLSVVHLIDAHAAA
jgi:hypothetical protein